MNNGEFRQEIKTYHAQYNIGKTKYVVNFHDGIKKHADGSKMFDIKIFRNRTEFHEFIVDLERQGYVHN